METGEKYQILVSVSGSPIFDVKGDFVGIVFSLEDITKQQQLEYENNKYKNVENNNLINQKLEESFEKIKKFAFDILVLYFTIIYFYTIYFSTKNRRNNFFIIM